MTLDDVVIHHVFERLRRSGDLDVLLAMIDEAAALIERDLLQKLGSYPVGSDADLCAFAYRQGWLQGLRQIRSQFEARGKDAGK